MKKEHDYRHWRDEETSGPNGGLIGVLLLILIAGAGAVAWNWDRIITYLFP